MNANPLAQDLDHVVEHTSGLWEELRGRRIFLTGGTGFFGTWLLESFAWANARLGLRAQVTVLTRDPEGFRRRAPHLFADPSIRFLAGDMGTFDPPTGDFSHIIHAATTTESQALGLFDCNVAATRRVLELTRVCRTEKLLFISSGAVYGRQPAGITHVREDYAGAPLPTALEAAYGHSKRVSEFLGAAHAAASALQFKIARCFAFVGPHLPLDANYAIGNFIRDALAGGPIRVNGDGTPYRSYLYTSDLMIWLWTILFKGQSGQPYNVGSDQDVTIADLAQQVRSMVAPNAVIRIAQAPVAEATAQRYVPSVERARRDLGLDVWIQRADAIHRTAAWYRQLSAPHAAEPLTVTAR